MIFRLSDAPISRWVLVGTALVAVAAGCGSQGSANVGAQTGSDPTSTATVPSSGAPTTTTIAAPTTTAAPTSTTTTLAPATTPTVAATPAALGLTPAAPGLTPATVPTGSVLEVGDSVSIDAAPYLEAAGVTVNGEVGRQWSAGIGVVQAAAEDHQLPPTLVVALGTNGTVTTEELDEMVQAARGVTHIVLVTIDVPRSWEAGDNQVLLAAPARYPGLVTVANFNALASGHPEWFTSDQVHLNPPGAEALAALIVAEAG